MYCNVLYSIYVGGKTAKCNVQCIYIIMYSNKIMYCKAGGVARSHRPRPAHLTITTGRTPHPPCCHHGEDGTQGRWQRQLGQQRRAKAGAAAMIAEARRTRPAALHAAAVPAPPALPLPWGRRHARTLALATTTRTKTKTGMKTATETKMRSQQRRRQDDDDYYDNYNDCNNNRAGNRDGSCGSIIISYLHLSIMHNN